MNGPNVYISARRAARRSNKMLKTSLLTGNSYIRSHIPPTAVMTQASLLRMLNRYGLVYIKPKHGSLGRGVIRISKQGTRYVSHVGVNVTSYTSFQALYSAIVHRTKKESYIVQKGIRSLRFRGNIFDLRVVVQKSPNGDFEVTGVAARIAQGGRVVSNGSGGGAVGTIDSLLTPHQRSIAMPRIYKLSLAVMAQIRKRWPTQNEIGIDIALDYDLKPWILEFNTRPDHRMFVLMGERRTIARIVRYGARYGRRYRLSLYR
jgi:glutathione synthase/RimK-type ligase-like ATP-grasp enzyme